MSSWVSKVEGAGCLNKEIMDELQYNELMLNQLEENFKKNIESVRSIIKKLSE